MRMILAMVVVSVLGSIQALGNQDRDPLSGDWQGTLSQDGKDQPLVAQVLALGHGEYRANLLAEFDTRAAPLAILNGKAADAGVTLSASPGGSQWDATLGAGTLTGTVSGARNGRFTLAPVERLSPALGKQPPAGAVVLFDGTHTDAWIHPKGKAPCKWTLADGAMTVANGGGNLLSKQVFKGDQAIHLEFRSPFQPEKRGQGRGNSGVYVQGMYEVQILDSYGLEGRDNECGGIYKVGAPRVNMCAPPMQWQSYDIDFTAPTFDEQGQKKSNARMTVTHNGVLIHEDLEVPRPTGASSTNTENKPNGLHLQDHGNPVQFRNIWVVDHVPAHR